MTSTKMFIPTIVLTTLVTLMSASPVMTKVKPRAGGPIAQPIPSTCTVTNPLPSPIAAETYIPNANDVLLYSAYYSSPSSNKTALAEQCLQQCYGYGNKGECRTAYWAENVPVPAGYYGSPGGQLSTACLFYNETLVTTDFLVAPEGQATTPFAGNIQC